MSGSSNLDDVGVVALSLYAIIFSFHDEIGSMEEDKDPEDYNLLLPLLRNGCFLIDPFV